MTYKNKVFTKELYDNESEEFQKIALEAQKVETRFSLPGRNKSSRSAFDLHLLTIEKLPEKIINGGYQKLAGFLFQEKIFSIIRALNGHKIA